MRQFFSRMLFVSLAFTVTPWFSPAAHAGPEEDVQDRVDRLFTPYEWNRMQGGGVNDAITDTDAADNGTIVSVGHFNLRGFARKYDAAGTQIWTRDLGVTTPNAVALHTDGRIAVAGTGGHPTIQNRERDGEGWVRLYDANGTFLWDKTIKPTTPDTVTGRLDAAAWGVDFDSAGNVYVTGFTWGALPGQPQAGMADGFLQKYDPAGTLVLTHQFGTSLEDSLWDVDIDVLGNVATSGSTWGTLGASSAGSEDGFVRLYDTSGNVTWTRQWGSSGRDSLIGVAVTGSGIGAGGYVFGANGPSPSYATGVAAGYSLSGNQTWITAVGDDDPFSFDAVIDVDADTTGAYVFGGFESLGGDPEPLLEFGGVDAQAFAYKFTPNGVQRWHRSWGTAGHDFVFGMAVTDSGETIVGGYSDGSIDRQFRNPLFRRPNTDTFIERLFVDSDGDCLSDAEENARYSTSPYDEDSNDDLIPDLAQATIDDTTGAWPPPIFRAQCVVTSKVTPIVDDGWRLVPHKIP